MGVSQLGERWTEDLRSNVRSMLTVGIYWIDALLSGNLNCVVKQTIFLLKVNLAFE